jgi:hypothetical protein
MLQLHMDRLSINITKVLRCKLPVYIHRRRCLKTVCTLCVQDPLGLIFLNFALQWHLLASCGVKILEVSAVAVYNFKAQASLYHVF